MEEKILNKLHEIEKEENIKILFAIESGSRGWEFASKDSDYDVRFVYLRNTNEYLRIDEVKDTLEYPIEELLDINGWDLKKTLTLLKKSNAPILEWLKSPIIYLDNYNVLKELLLLSQEFWSKKKLIYHYKSLAKKSMTNIQEEERARVKKYFYALRPILSCIWIEEKNEQPPMEFGKLMELVSDIKIRESIFKLLELKKSSNEYDRIKKEEIILNFLQEKLKYYDKYVSQLEEDNKKSYESINGYFIKLINKIWS